MIGVEIRELVAGGFSSALELAVDNTPAGYQLAAAILVAEGPAPTPGDRDAAYALTEYVARAAHTGDLGPVPYHVAGLAFETLITPADLAAVVWPDHPIYAGAKAQADQAAAELRDRSAAGDTHAYAVLAIVTPCPRSTTATEET